MRWPFLLALALAFGFASPGAADLLSRRRDDALAERINAAVRSVRPPATWTFVFGPVTYTCIADRPMVPMAPAYHCSAVSRAGE